jgi:hypothetical protein
MKDLRGNMAEVPAWVGRPAVRAHDDQSSVMSVDLSQDRRRGVTPRVFQDCAPDVRRLQVYFLQELLGTEGRVGCEKQMYRHVQQRRGGTSQRQDGPRGR